jgi:hypothetical protein
VVWREWQKRRARCNTFIEPKVKYTQKYSIRK